MCSETGRPTRNGTAERRRKLFEYNDFPWVRIVLDQPASDSWIERWRGELRRWRSWASVLILALASSACSDATGPGSDTAEEDALVFLRFSAAALPLATREGSFWAVKGEGRELILRYAPEKPGDQGEEFLKFKVGGNSLVRRPNGSLFAQGDSVRITVRVDDAGRFLFEFEPSGLVFDARDPAELEVRYRRADDDYNRDGKVDDDDRRFESRLNIWKRERPGSPWFRQGTVRFEDDDEIKAKITSFTGFAVAS